MARINTLYAAVSREILRFGVLIPGMPLRWRVNRSDYTDSKSVQPGATPGLSASKKDSRTHPGS